MYKKKISVFFLSMLLVMSSLTVPAMARENTSEENFAETFADAVTLDSGLWSRLWFNDGDLSYDAIYKELENLAQEGIVRIEVAKGFVWTNSEENMNAFYYLLKAATELGISLDFATGNPYPAVTGTQVLEVNGKVYYDPAEIGYDSETCDVKSMSYAFKNVGEGLDGENVLTGVSAWQSMGFMGTALAENIDVTVDDSNGEKIFAITANYIDADGKTILAGIDLTDKESIVSYTESEGRNIDAVVTVTPENLNEMCTPEEQEAIASSDGEWVIFTFYTQKESNTVCYLSYYSTRVWTNWFEKGVIDNDAYWTEVLGLEAGEVRSLFNGIGAGLWEDSLEAINISYTDYAGVDEDGNDYDIFKAFELLNGYELPGERLVTLFINGGANYAMSGGFASDADFVYDSVEDKQLRHDYYDTLTEAYSANHLQVYTDWAQNQGDGMDTRVQAAYMYALNQDEAYSHVTIPEQETLNATDHIDIFRGVAGAAHSSGSNIISSETGARSVFFQGETYTMAWYDWLWHANNQYMGGVNETVLHGTEYTYASTSVWPGPCMAMVSGGLAEPTGYRMPYKEVMNDTVSSYLAREQYILQEGQADLDVAVYYYYMELGNDYLDYFLDDCMATAGYTYEFLGDTSFTNLAESSDGSVLAEDGPSYKALVIDQYRAGKEEEVSGFGNATPQFTGNGYMPLETAQAVLKMAEQGMPIVIVGDAPDKSAKAADNYVDGEYVEGYGDAQVQEIFDQILQLNNVVQVESEADVADGLLSLGITPDSSFDQETAAQTNPDWGTVDLYTVHRSAENVDYYMLFNRSHTVWWEDEEYDESVLNVNKDHSIATYVEFEAEEGSVPYLLDCWTGEVNRIADYTVTEDGKYRIYVDLDASDTMIIAIGTEDWYTDGNDSAETAVSREAKVGYDENGNITVSADEAGTYTITLGTGETIDVTIDEIPDTISLTDGSVDWTLSLKLYRPTDEWIENPTTDYTYYDYDETGESGITTITYEYIDGIDPLGEDGLLAWVNLDDLGENPERASGVGSYMVTVTLPDEYDPEKEGYVLNFDEVVELYTVTVNGQKIIFDQTASHTSSGDISAYLKAGENTIEITVASGLFNAAKYYNTQASEKNEEITAEQSENDWTSRDGIIGNVNLTGYGRTVVD